MKTRAFVFSALFTLTLGACDADEASTREGVAAADEGRGGLGKADHLEGSCAPDEDGSICGGPAPVGNCWCDEACINWGDCCEDAWTMCGVGEPPPSCDDGTAVHPLCDIVPGCEAGEVAAISNGCFQCVDPETCEPAPPPPVEPDCDDGTSLSQFCDIKPVCDDGQVAAIINSCFECVDALTCEPPAPEPEVDCDDGTSLHFLCDIKPGCPDGEVAAIINSCFHCVDAVTCE